MGTSGVVFAALPGFASDPQGRVHAFCHAVPGPVARDGRDALGRGVAAVAPRPDRAGTSFADLVAEAEAWGPGSKGSSSRPTWRASGRRTPIRTRRGAFTGLELRHDRGALVRAVLEGVAFGLRDSLELVRALGGPARPGRASGGGARSGSGCGSSPPCSASDRAHGGRGRLGLRRRAPRRGRRRGLRRRARRGRPCVRVRATVDPDPAWQTVYADTYARFRALYPALAPFRP